MNGTAELVSPDLEQVQRQYAGWMRPLRKKHGSEVSRAIRVQNTGRVRYLTLRMDCLRYEYLILFEDVEKAEEAWENYLHPLYAKLKGYE